MAGVFDVPSNPDIPLSVATNRVAPVKQRAGPALFAVDEAASSSAAKKAMKAARYGE